MRIREYYFDEVRNYNTFSTNSQSDNSITELLQTCVRGIELSNANANVSATSDNYQINALFKKGLSIINSVTEYPKTS